MSFLLTSMIVVIVMCGGGQSDRWVAWSVFISYFTVEAIGIATFAYCVSTSPGIKRFVAPVKAEEGNPRTTKQPQLHPQLQSQSPVASRNYTSAAHCDANLHETLPILQDVGDSQSYHSYCSNSSIISGYCSECNIAIELSTKHCSQCEICVPDFDHHCPIMNNCIGGQNYVPFIVTCICFCIAASIEAGWCVWIGCERNHIIAGLLYLNALAAMAVAVAIASLVLFHWYLWHLGLSTYEYFSTQNRLWSRSWYDRRSSNVST
eukprot:CFRG3834T1